MPRFIEGDDRAQASLFPERLDDYVAEDNPVRIVEAFVDSLDLVALKFRRAEPLTTGRPGYHASTLLKIYIYGYLNRIASSQRLERECRRNVELMWLTERLTPDYKTIAEFRKDNGHAIVRECREFVQLCRRLSMMADAEVAIDGSKFKAVNNRDKNFTEAKMKRRKDGIAKTITHYLAELDEADRAEPEVAQANVPAIKARLGKLHEEMAKLELYEQALNACGDKQLSLTDPDARAMNARGSTVVGYNVQTVVDTTHHLIVAHEVVNNPTDIALLNPMAEKARTALGTAQLDVLSDRGYFAGPQIAACEGSGIRTWVPKPLRSVNRKRGLFTKDDFVYEPEHDHYRCPAGELLTRRGWSVEKGMRMWSYAAPLATCRGCSMRAQCNRNPGARRIRRWEKESVLEAMQARLARAPEKLQLRRHTVEHPFGTLKAWMGYTHFLTKTLPRVRTEMSLLVLAYNLKRVMRILGVRGMLRELALA